MELSLQDAQNLLTYIEAIERVADPSPAELDALQRARAANPQAVVDSFSASFRGMAQGATLGGGDEIVAAGAGLMPGGLNYTEALETQRQKNSMAQQADPEAYATGRSAGQIGAGGAAFAIPSVAAARGLGAAGKVLLGGTEGAALASAPQFLEGEGGFASRIAEVSPAAALVGGAMGGAAPFAGAITGGLTRMAQNTGRGMGKYGSRATQVAARGVGRTDTSGDDIQAYLASIGDEGMLADVPGGPMSQAQGLAAQQGTGGTIVNRALADRAKGSEGRIDDTFTRLVAGPNDAFRRRVSLAAERSGTLGPAYDAALKYSDPIDTSSILSKLDEILPDATGQTRSALSSLRAEVLRGGPETTAARLHNIRAELSDTISEATRAGRGGLVSALKPVLDVADTSLDAVPNYAATRGSYADNKAMERAVDDGRKVFSGGATSSETPEALAARWSGMTTAEREAFRVGAREYVATLMGTSRNAPASAWGTMTTGFNDKKMAIVFGNDQASEISRLLAGERAFSATRGAVSSGSMTEMRRQAQAELGPVADPDTGRAPGPIARVKRAVDDSANAAIDSILYGSSRSNANADLGKILSLTGAERDAAVSALLAEAMRQRGSTRSQAVVKMLTEMGIGAAIPATTNGGPQ